MCVNRASTEHKQSINNYGYCICYNPRTKQRLLSIIKVLAAYMGNVVNVVVTTRKVEHQQSIRITSTERQQSINRASTILGVAFCIIQGRCYCVYPESKYWPHLRAIWSVSMSLHRIMIVNRSSTEHQQSINSLGCCIVYNPTTVLWHLPIINVLAAVIGKRDWRIVTFLV